MEPPNSDPAQDRLTRQMDFLLEIDKLKSVLRRNRLADNSRRENTAEHSWHLVMFISVLAEYVPGIQDLSKAMLLGAIHDLVEIDAGDTFFWDAKGYEDKKERESEAAQRIFGLLPTDQAQTFRALWEEFEEAQTPEALLANAADRLAPVLLNTHSGGVSWKENGITPSMIRQKMTIIGKASPQLGHFLELLIHEAQQRGSLDQDRPGL